MKFNTRFFLKDREGEEKVVRKFLWFPAAFNQDTKRRWLEYADVVYEVKKIDTGWSCEWSSYAWRWQATRFANDNDLKNLPIEKTESWMPSSSGWFMIADILGILIMMISKNLDFGIVFLLSVKISQTLVLMMERSRNEM